MYNLVRFYCMFVSDFPSEKEQLEPRFYNVRNNSAFFKIRKKTSFFLPKMKSTEQFSLISCRQWTKRFHFKENRVFVLIFKKRLWNLWVLCFYFITFLSRKSVIEIQILVMKRRVSIVARGWGKAALGLLEGLHAFV